MTRKKDQFDEAMEEFSRNLGLVLMAGGIIYAALKADEHPKADEFVEIAGKLSKAANEMNKFWWEDEDEEGNCGQCCPGTCDGASCKDSEGA